jgi:hypothetical protein
MLEQKIKTLCSLLETVDYYTPFHQSRQSIYVTNGDYFRVIAFLYNKHGGQIPVEPGTQYKYEVIYRPTHPNKIQYWDPYKDRIGYMSENAHIEDITEEQVDCLIKILEEARGESEEC